MSIFLIASFTIWCICVCVCERVYSVQRTHECCISAGIRRQRTFPNYELCSLFINYSLFLIETFEDKNRFWAFFESKGERLLGFRRIAFQTLCGVRHSVREIPYYVSNIPTFATRCAVVAPVHQDTVWHKFALCAPKWNQKNRRTIKGSEILWKAD